MPRRVVPIWRLPSFRSRAPSRATCHGMIRCALPERKTRPAVDVAAALEVVELVDHDLRVDDAAGADRGRLAGDDPRRDLADLVRLAVDDDRVPRVRPALVAADEVGVLGEQVDDLALPLVAPLRTDDHGGRHESILQRQRRRRVTPIRSHGFARRRGRRYDDRKYFGGEPLATLTFMSESLRHAINRNVWPLAVVVVAGAIMSILDTTIVNVALETLSVDLKQPDRLRAVGRHRLHARARRRDPRHRLGRAPARHPAPLPHLARPLHARLAALRPRLVDRLADRRSASSRASAAGC